MTTNSRTPAELQLALEAIIGELRAIEWNDAPAESLVPLALSLKAVSDHVELVQGQIELRAIANGISIPGAAVKDATTHRQWNDCEVAADLAFTQFGLRAFKLVSPAAIEKLGSEGQALVAVASFKPPAGKRVVY